MNLTTKVLAALTISAALIGGALALPLVAVMGGFGLLLLGIPPREQFVGSSRRSGTTSYVANLTSQIKEVAVTVGIAVTVGYAIRMIIIASA